MTAVLADLAVESWAAPATASRLASLVQQTQDADRAPAGGALRDVAEGSAVVDAAALLRIALPVSKFWVCKRTVPMIAEALECLGGNGYVETYPMARLLRESPLNGIWEGSGSVTALDALRALQRSPGCGDALLDELAVAAGMVPAFDRTVDTLKDLLRQTADPATARRVSSLAARLLAASLLIRQAPGMVAELYCDTRLNGLGDRVFGELPTGYPLGDLVASVTPVLP
jgi:putative acyl-CoA dehydrogenase